jgi:hypothetical protein
MYTPMKLVDGGDRVIAVAEADMPVLTADLVRDTLERTRRSTGPSTPGVSHRTAHAARSQPQVLTVGSTFTDDYAGDRLCLPNVDERALAGLKFSEALPTRLATATLAARGADLDGAARVLTEPVCFWNSPHR